MPTLSMTDSALSPPESQFSDTTRHEQRDPDAAALAGGQWAVAWETFAISGEAPHDATLQLFAANGAAVGGPITAQPGATGPQVLGLADGSVLVAWTDRSGDDAGDIFAQRYSAEGQPLGGRFMLNAAEPYTQRLVDLVALRGGGFVAVWTSANQVGEGGSPGHTTTPGPLPTFVKAAQVFDAGGARLGGPIALTGAVAQALPDATVAALADGGFVALTIREDAANPAMTAQVYTAAGAANGPAVQLAASVSIGDRDAAVVGLPDGGFVAALRMGSVNSDVRVMRFLGDGTHVGADTVVTPADGSQTQPRLVATPDGGFLLTLLSDAGPGSDGNHLYAQQFDAAAHPLTTAWRLDDATFAYSPALAVDSAGTAIVAWNINAPGDGYFNPDVHGRLVERLDPALETAVGNLLRAGVPSATAAAVMDGEMAMGPTATAALVDEAAATTSVATLAYEFFTGRTPSSAGLDYLVSPVGPNANSLNSAYYQSFNLENRYINFAVNLGKGGEGAQAFASAYGPMSLFEATRTAYTTIFGGAPSDAKVHALIDTRADYFAYYGQDGAEGLGAKAAMVGWLLAEAVKADLGVYARVNDAYLTDLADGAPYNIDIVGAYNQPDFAYHPT